jgi:hypothetical protein
MRWYDRLFLFFSINKGHSHFNNEDNTSNQFNQNEIILPQFYPRFFTG